MNFTIYNDRLKYKSYDQPSLVNWVSTKDDNYKYQPVKYALGSGTLMISIIEAETSEIVWRGYATGIFNKASSKQNYFKSIIRNIFDQYPLLAIDKKQKGTLFIKTMLFWKVEYQYTIFDFFYFKLTLNKSLLC